MELHTIKARLTAGLVNKARRGELALTLPAGLVRDELGRVTKHPDAEVRSRIELVFTAFLQLRSLAKVMRLREVTAVLDTVLRRVPGTSRG